MQNRIKYQHYLEIRWKMIIKYHDNFVNIIIFDCKQRYIYKDMDI
jgi:hypothetical protein